MRLCFLMERRYAPYPKWFGSAFGRLHCSATLTSALQAALTAATWQERESALVTAYEAVATMQNRLRLTEELPTETRAFFERPFRVIHLHAAFADALRAQIRDPEVKRIAEGRQIGSIDQFSDSTDLLCAVELRQTIRRLYD